MTLVANFVKRIELSNKSYFKIIEHYDVIATYPTITQENMFKGGSHGY